MGLAAGAAAGAAFGASLGGKEKTTALHCAALHCVALHCTARSFCVGLSLSSLVRVSGVTCGIGAFDCADVFIPVVNADESIMVRVGALDARNTLISKQRSQMKDAREKLMKLAKTGDAREKLEKIRNLKQGKVSLHWEREHE